MKDRVVQYPHRYQLMPVSGQNGVYDLIPVPGTVTEAGTALNKGNLLSDETAALFGMSGDGATPDNVLSALGHSLKCVTGTFTASGAGAVSYLEFNREIKCVLLSTYRYIYASTNSYIVSGTAFFSDIGDSGVIYNSNINGASTKAELSTRTHITFTPTAYADTYTGRYLAFY